MFDGEIAVWTDLEIIIEIAQDDILEQWTHECSSCYNSRTRLAGRIFTLSQLSVKWLQDWHPSTHGE